MIKIVKRVPGACRTPKYHGLCWYDAEQNTYITAIMPLNIIIRLGYQLHFWAKYTRGKCYKRLYNEMKLDETRREIERMSR